MISDILESEISDDSLYAVVGSGDFFRGNVQ